MFPKLGLWPALGLAFAVSLIVSYFMTPPVKNFAEKIGAMDVPKDGRRVHDHPIPRMGGLAIIMGFVLAVLLFVPTLAVGTLLFVTIVASIAGAFVMLKLKLV